MHDTVKKACDRILYLHSGKQTNGTALMDTSKNTRCEVAGHSQTKRTTHKHNADRTFTIGNV